MLRLRTPGPGAYDIDVTSRGARATTGNDTRASHMFKSTSAQRGRLGKSDSGDPALYDDFKEALSDRAQRTFNRSISSGDLGFQSSSRGRSTAPPSRTQRGGPGEHECGHLFEMGAIASSPSSTSGRGSGSAAAGTSSFKSALPLGGHIRKSFTPGIGTYDTTSAGSISSPARGTYSKEGMSMFAATSARQGLADTKRTEAHVAPGSYDVGGSLGDEAKAAANPRLPGFQSSVPRDMGSGSRWGVVPCGFCSAGTRTWRWRVAGVRA